MPAGVYHVRCAAYAHHDLYGDTDDYAEPVPLADTDGNANPDTNPVTFADTNTHTDTDTGADG